jgi:transposase
VAEVARAHGVNANQLFKWRRAFECDELSAPCAALVPVTVASPEESTEPEEAATAAGGSIHVELPGRDSPTPKST